MADKDDNKKDVEIETSVAELNAQEIKALIPRVEHFVEDCERRSRELETTIEQIKKGREETVKICNELKVYAQQSVAWQRDKIEVTDMINYMLQWLHKKIIDFYNYTRERIRRRKRKRSTGLAEGSDSSQSTTLMKNFSVLVVEDDSRLRNLYNRLLNLFGHLSNFRMKVEVAANGKEAVAVLRGGVSFNLIIIMDLDRSTYTLEEIRELRALGVESNIIGYTSSTAEAPHQQQSFMEAGLNGCFQKPMTFEIIADFLLNPTTNN